MNGCCTAGDGLFLPYSSVGSISQGNQNNLINLHIFKQKASYNAAGAYRRVKYT